MQRADVGVAACVRSTFCLGSAVGLACFVPRPFRVSSALIRNFSLADANVLGESELFYTELMW